MNRVNAFELDGTGGAIWGTETDDLDATVVRWDADYGVAPHTNEEVDVIMTVLGGSGTVVVDGQSSFLEAGHILVIGKGTDRKIRAGTDGITYLNVHKRRKRMMPNMVRPTS